MKDFTLLEWLIVAAIILILFVIVFAPKKTSDDFNDICSKAGGITAWDGRQYQCIK